MIVPFSPQDPARWGEDTYAWFMVGKVAGGTDAYYDEDKANIQELWEEELDQPSYTRLGPLVRECIATGHRWWFRRSIGQPAVVNVAYGLIAASVASLTGGFLTSFDSAWDYQRFPALPEEFLGWYFRPEQAIEDGFREWSQRCLELLRKELR